MKRSAFDPMSTEPIRAGKATCPAPRSCFAPPRATSFIGSLSDAVCCEFVQVPLPDGYTKLEGDRWETVQSVLGSTVVWSFATHLHGSNNQAIPTKSSFSDRDCWGWDVERSIGRPDD